MNTGTNPKTTADVTALDIQLTRTDGAFTARVIGDGEELLAELITDEGWELTQNVD